MGLVELIGLAGTGLRERSASLQSRRRPQAGLSNDTMLDRSRVPLSKGCSCGGVSGTPQAEAGCTDQRERKTGVDEPAHLRVRPLPLGRKAGGETLGSGLSLGALQAIYQEHKGSEMTTSSKAMLNVLVFLLLLVLG
jgi:hypothetical protein